jgi:hypothetical protein
VTGVSEPIPVTALTFRRFVMLPSDAPMGGFHFRTHGTSGEGERPQVAQGRLVMGRHAQRASRHRTLDRRTGSQARPQRVDGRATRPLDAK